MGFAEKYSQLIKQKAREIGFDFCGIAKAEFLEKEAPRLEMWLKNNMQGEMSYMANHFDKRLNPKLLVEGAKSVISVLLNYFPKQDLAQTNPDNFKISKYAYGEDYHFVMKRKMNELLNFIRENIGEINGRAFVDSAPVMDKVWAERSGLGWIGKHTNLINRKIGSFFFIGEIIIDLELAYDAPTGDYCGTCRRCLEACPTEAIVSPYVVDGSKCISYLTIELKNEIPQEFQGKMENWIFGCDVCQDVCPWNRFAKPHQTPEFEPNEHLKNMQKKDWLEITEEVFAKVFPKSAVKRTKIKGLQRNIQFASLE
ncbi:tRNA epoxyqueuosine(34) reductase QueG [Raineya orbicola]|uniref:Epoxyqueuosine reductase n=1 Tax=Raineya orbicola TaxID=2016530 RepID=A0A2N3IAQ2_9BACT|nr:tRNA epoxyqueuosine(34) reductase QueG [Raineya orbicola]PKQ67411.1 Epoxyqueuosine reductase [Raineya orbicola]